MGMSHYYRRALGVPRDPEPPVFMVDTPPVIKRVEPMAVLAEIFKPAPEKLVKPKAEKEKVWPSKPKTNPVKKAPEPKKAVKAKAK